MNDLTAPAAPSPGFDFGAPPPAATPYRVLARKYRPSSFADALVARTPAALTAAFNTTTFLGVRISISCDPTGPIAPLTTAFVQSCRPCRRATYCPLRR